MTTAWRQSLLTSRPSGLEEYAKSLADCPSTVWLSGTIADIAIAPIKALGMLHLRTAMVTKHGLATPTHDVFDRGVMLGLEVKNKPWQFTRFSQREEPRLVLAKPEWDGASLTYTAPGMHQSLELQSDELRWGYSPTAQVRMTTDDDLHDAHPSGGKIRSWLLEFLAKHSTGGYDINDVHVLVRPWHFNRFVKDRHRCDIDAQTMYTDGGQLLVASASTLAWMNEEIAKTKEGFKPLDMEAFRPNIVLSKLPPNMEDVIKKISIDKHRMLFGGLCVRCPVTQVDQAAGTRRSDKQPLAWLGKHRPARPPENTSSTFGVNCVLEDGDERWKLHVGEVLEVEEEK